MREYILCMSHSGFLTGVGDYLCINSMQTALAWKEGTKGERTDVLSFQEVRSGTGAVCLTYHTTLECDSC